MCTSSVSVPVYMKSSSRRKPTKVSGTEISIMADDGLRDYRVVKGRGGHG